VPQDVYNGNNVSGTSCIIDRQRRSVCTRVLTSQRVNANNITTIRHIIRIKITIIMTCNSDNPFGFCSIFRFAYTIILFGTSTVYVYGIYIFYFINCWIIYYDLLAVAPCEYFYNSNNMFLIRLCLYRYNVIMIMYRWYGISKNLKKTCFIILTCQFFLSQFQHF